MKWSICKAIVFLLLIVWSVVSGVQAATHTVNPGDSIQDKINTANPSDTIYVNAGTYNEHLVINKTLTLIGTGFPVVDGQSIWTDTVSITADGVVFTGFNVTNATSAGISIKAELPNTANSNQIRDNIIYHNRVYGVLLTGSDETIIEGNTILDTFERTSPPLIGGGIYLINSEGNVISENTVSQSNYSGINLYYSSFNTVEDNVVNQGDLYGIVVGRNSPYNVITRNTVMNNGKEDYGTGIVVSRTSYTTVSENVVMNNVVEGIRFAESNHSIAMFNTISNNGLTSNYGGGVNLYASNNITVKQNNITENYNIGLLADSAGSLQPNYVYLNNFTLNSTNIYSEYGVSFDSTIIWNSPDPVTYSYHACSYTNYTGNYWPTYGGPDANSDGIGDIPFNLSISSPEVDSYPLMEGWPSYSIQGPLPEGNSITNCTTISEPGSYILQNDITDDEATWCIQITSDDVIFDGNGYTIQRSESPVFSYSTQGVRASSDHVLTNVTVTNLSVLRWGTGIYYNTTENSQIEDIYLAEGNGFGIVLEGGQGGNTLVGIGAAGNRDTGILIVLSNGTTLRGSVAEHTRGLIVRSAGVHLLYSNASTLEFNSVLYNNDTGILLESSHGNTIYNNDVTLGLGGNFRDGDGIQLIDSHGNNLSNNQVTNNNNIGIYVDSSDANDIISNQMLNNTRGGIFLNVSDHATIAGNTVTGVTDGHGITLVGCNDVTMEDNEFSANEDAIAIDESVNTMCRGTTIQNVPEESNGISIVHSQLTTLRDSFITGIGSRGVFIQDSQETLVENVTITGNSVSSSCDGVGGIYRCFNGIQLRRSTNNNLTGNTLRDNNGYGVFIEYTSANNTITKNQFENNTVGIVLEISPQSNNTIYWNNFINNWQMNGFSDDYPNFWNTPEPVTYQYQGNSFTNYTGNYWDDYTERGGYDANGDGIGDILYAINYSLALDHNFDFYPLIAPWQSYTVPAPVYILPVANFTATPLSGNAPLSVQFTDTSSGAPTSYAWEFGDGGTATSPSPSHLYQTPDTYTVTLTVQNVNGTDTETKINYIVVGRAPAAHGGGGGGGSSSFTVYEPVETPTPTETTTAPAPTDAALPIPPESLAPEGSAAVTAAPTATALPPPSGGEFPLLPVAAVIVILLIGAGLYFSSRSR